MRRPILLALLATLLLAAGAPIWASCQEDTKAPETRLQKKPSPPPGTQDQQDRSDVLSALQWDGFVTYVRYTSLTSTPWPTRTVAWLDVENDRSRSWSIQETDSATNPFVSTSVREGDRLYPELPALNVVDVTDEAFAASSVPLRRGTEVRMSWPLFEGGGTFAFVGEPAETESEEFGLHVKKYRWAASPPAEPEDLAQRLCGDNVKQASYFYEYATDMEGVPVYESLLANCDGEDRGFAGIVYHEVGFVDPHELPADFFDPKAVRDDLVADQISAFTTRFGRPYWLGFEIGPYALASIELCDDRCLELQYWPSDLEDSTHPALSLRVEGHGGTCDNAQSLEPEVPGAKLCSRPNVSETGEVVWDPPDFHVSLAAESDDTSLFRDDLIAIARNLRPYDGPTASGRPPILTMEEVRAFVADALDLVCFDKWTTIREYRDSAFFEYDEAAGEWRGQFGSLGEWAVTDPGKPTAWPVATRELVSEYGGSYAAGYAECGFEAEGKTDEVEAARQLVRPREALARLKSYRYRERVLNDYVDEDEADNLSVFEGSFVAPDRGEVRWWPTIGGVPQQEPVARVVIGNRDWVSYGHGWEEGPATSDPTDFGPFDHLYDFLVDLKGLEPVRETVNGVSSLRYDLLAANMKDLGFIRLLSSGIDEESWGFEAHLWLAEDGRWPVRLLISSPADEDGRPINFEYSMDITDANDSGIEVEPPVP